MSSTASDNNVLILTDVRLIKFPQVFETSCRPVTNRQRRRPWTLYRRQGPALSTPICNFFTKES